MFYGLAGVLPKVEAIKLMKQSIETQYSHKGPKVIAKNMEAVDAAMDRLQRIDYPANWLTTEKGGSRPTGDEVSAIATVLKPVRNLRI